MNISNGIENIFKTKEHRKNSMSYANKELIQKNHKCSNLMLPLWCQFLNIVLK